MALLHVTGIILKGQKYRETSKILRVFTQQQGKISVIAKGVRGPRARQMGQLEALNLVELSLYVKPGQDLHLLQQVDLVTPFGDLRKDFPATAIALALAEVLHRTTLEGDPHPDLYRRLLEVLHSLNQGTRQPMNAYWWFLLGVQADHGCPLVVSTCVHCGKSLPGEPVPFHLAIGGTVCPACPDAGIADLRVAPETRKVVEYLQVADIGKVGQLRMTQRCRTALGDLMHRYMRYHIEGFQEPEALRLLEPLSHTTAGPVPQPSAAPGNTREHWES